MKDIKISKISASVPSTENLPIYYDLYYPANRKEDDLPVILFLHGFKGFKDWGAFPEGCRELSKKGFAVLAMNFSLNGVGKSMTEFDQLDLFARETLSKDLEDVGTVIKALKEKVITGQGVSLDADTIGVLGHSRGGHTAVAASAEYPEIKCLVTWSAVADYNARWSDDMISDWEERGVTEIKNGRTGQIMPVKEVVFNDAMENADRLMAVKRVRVLNIPALFVHAKGDEGVPYSEAVKLYEYCTAEDKKIELIPGSGHTFDTAHPFEAEQLPEPFAKVVNMSGNWFQTHLK